MSFEEKGAYMELLMVQFNRGHMTLDMIGQTVGQIWPSLKDKFVQDEHGLWYNPRLEQEKIKRAKFTESRRNNKKGVNQYTKKGDKINGHIKDHMGGHMSNHMENENKDIVLMPLREQKQQSSDPSEKSLEDCIQTALRDEQWMRRNKTNQAELEIFKQKLEDEGVYNKVPIDFKSHFHRWKKKDPDELKTQSRTYQPRMII